MYIYNLHQAMEWFYILSKGMIFMGNRMEKAKEKFGKVKEKAKETLKVVKAVVGNPLSQGAKKVQDANFKEWIAAYKAIRETAEKLVLHSRQMENSVTKLALLNKEKNDAVEKRDEKKFRKLTTDIQAREGFIKQNSDNGGEFHGAIHAFDVAESPYYKNLQLVMEHLKTAVEKYNGSGDAFKFMFQ